MFPECDITIKIKCNANRNKVMDCLCLMSETVDMRRLDEFIYSTDSYYYLLKKYTVIFAVLLWMKRMREPIVIPPLQNYKRNQKERLQLIQEMHSQTNDSGISA